MLDDVQLDDNKPGRDSVGHEPVSAADPDGYWLGLAQSAFSSSTDWLDANVRSRWERNLAHFHNRHASGSKFESAAYRGRSRIFNPKTRSAGRTAEAAFAAAMFSTADLVDIKAEQTDNPKAVASARVNQSLLQYRLSKTIPWFLTSVGAFQDGYNYGICVSYQYWDFDEREYAQPVLDDAGAPTYDELGQQRVQTIKRLVKDKPCIDLMPPENLRIDPAADWRDPINSSPYAIRLVPMFACDILDRMKHPRAGGVKWRQLNLATLISAKTEKYDSTRNARNDQRQDPTAEQNRNEHSIVWLHENFIRENGEELVYWTVGSEFMLSDPIPLQEAYFHGKRPMTLGYVVLEAHKPYPSAPADLTAGLQEASNDLRNQRFDNVALVLNKRYFIRRGQQMDTEALMRNTPGGGVFMDDPERDVRIVSTPDVTQSSYEEQDRIDLQMDEMAGNFSQSSIQGNKDQKQTLGEIKLVSGSASAISEYTIRTFVETWVEPTLRQLMLLEQYYETDENILALAGKDAELMDKFGTDEVTDDILIQELNLSVNVGIGATNPQQKVERFLYGMNALAQIPRVASRINADESIKEVMGALGYKTGERFFMTEEEAQKIPDPMVQVEKLKAENEAKTLAIDETRVSNDHQYRMAEIDRRQKETAAKINTEREMGYADLALREGVTVKQLMVKLEVANKQDKTKRQVEALKASSVQNELLIKRKMGSGI